MKADGDAAADQLEEEGEEGGEELDGVGFVAYVAVPDQDAIKRAVLVRRKQELLARLGATDGPKLLEEDVEEAEPQRLPPSW